MTYHFKKQQLWRTIAIILGICSPLLFLSPVTFAKPADKVEVCHVPPDDPTNAHIIKIGASAVPSHQAHGDLVPATQSEGSVQGYCSDGIDNDCNGLVDSQDPTCTRSHRYVFVTSESYRGNLISEAATRNLIVTNGLDAADALCNKAASDAGLDQTKGFTAWVSSTSANAKDRATGVATLEYRLVDDQVVFPASPTSRFLGPYTLTNSIHLDETGTAIGTFNRVWTNTNADGTSAGSGSCGDYSSANPNIFGLVGSSQETDSKWTNVGISSCASSTLHLYCFENP